MVMAPSRPERMVMAPRHVVLAVKGSPKSDDELVANAEEAPNNKELHQMGYMDRNYSSVTPWQAGKVVVELTAVLLVVR